MSIRTTVLLCCFLALLLTATITLAAPAPLDTIDVDPFEAAAAQPNSPYRSDCWPGWRGYDGRGIAPKNSPPVEFGPEKSVRWKIAVPGKGFSSPVIWENKLFLTTEIEKVLYLCCFDRGNGEMLWKAETGTAHGQTHSDNGYATATPAVDGKYVLTFFGASGLFCHDFDGRELWKVDLGNLQHMYGLAASPMLYKNLVIQLCDNKTDSFIAAFEKETGKEVWRVPRKGGGGWTTPVLAVGTDAEGKPRDELIVNGDCPDILVKGTLFAYEPASGEVLWTCAGPIGWGIPTPMISGDVVFVLAGLSGKALAVQLGGEGDVSKKKVLWERTNASPYIASGVAYRNRIYIPSDHNKIDCLNAGNGKTVYSKKIFDQFYPSLLAADGRIYALTRSGKALVFEAGDEGKTLWKIDFEEL